MFEASVTDIPLAGCEALRGLVSVAGCVHCARCLPAAFLGHLALVLPTLPSNSPVVGDINTDLNPESYLHSASEDYSELIQNQSYSIPNNNWRDQNKYFRSNYC